MVNNGVRSWNLELQGLSLIIDEVMKRDCPQDTMKLRPLQCWIIQEEKEAYVAELLGFQGERAVIRK